MGDHGPHRTGSGGFEQTERHPLHVAERDADETGIYEDGGEPPPTERIASRDAMRNGHHQNNKRMRGRHQHHNNRKNQNPLTRAYESNGPDVKIRGTASTIAEKYIQLARDAQSSGDPVAAENYYQHAEHYFRLIAAAQEQLRQQNPGHFQQPQMSGQSPDEGMDDNDDDFPGNGQNEPYAREQPQPYLPRETQPYQPREQQGRPQNQQNRYNQNQPQPTVESRDRDGNRDTGRDVGGLPSFITGGQPQPTEAAAAGQDERTGERFPLHRRRRRHRGNRPDFGQGQPADAVEDQPGE